MMEIDSTLKKAAEERILARRDSLLKEQEEVRQEMAKLNARDRELDRYLAECRAAAGFFGIVFDPLEDDLEVTELRTRVRLYRGRAEETRRQGHPDAGMYARRAEEYEGRLRALIAQKQATATPPPPQITAPEDTGRHPKVRDALLERLREIAPNGDKAARLRRHVETAHALNLHEKTVGMTLYRLSKDSLVHRKGQIWFYGPQVGPLLPASAENPGAGGTGA